MAELVTYIGVTHPWMCDAMGHMNVRFYMGAFDDASFQLLGHLSGVETDGSLGWADVRHEIDYKDETPAGALITIKSQVTRIGRSSVAYRHVMVGTLSGRVHAEATVITVRFDLAARKSVELDGEIRSRAEALFAGQPEA